MIALNSRQWLLIIDSGHIGIDSAIRDIVDVV